MKQVGWYLLPFFLSVIFIACQHTYRDTVDYQYRFERDTLEGVYIPKDLDDCFDQLNHWYYDPHTIQNTSMTEDYFVGSSHIGIGLYIRNNWWLWRGSRLSKYFNDLGIYHPDDMSGIVLTSYYRYLKKEPIRLDEQVSQCKKYWENRIEK